MGTRTLTERVSEMVSDGGYYAYPMLSDWNFSYCGDEVWGGVTQVVVRHTGDKSKRYVVDVKAKTCTCPSFGVKGECKHLRGVIRLLLASEKVYDARSEAVKARLNKTHDVAEYRELSARFYEYVRYAYNSRQFGCWLREQNAKAREERESRELVGTH
jgi:hypothetical protein